MLIEVLDGFIFDGDDKKFEKVSASYHHKLMVRVQNYSVMEIQQRPLYLCSMVP